MDIHPPHSPIRSVRDFLLQIFTVTCGIIIALSLENLVEWRRDETLARLTREDFRSEITHNLDNLMQQLPAWTADFASMKAMVAFGEARLRHEAQKPPAMLSQRGFTTLSKSAWDTALATQAMHRLNVEEARQIADTYNKQAAFNDLMDHAEHQWVAMAAYSEDFDTIPDADARAALGSLRVAAAYAGSILATEDKVAASYGLALKALAGRH